MENHYSDNNDLPYVRASDIGTYLYCQRAWWLEHVAGQTPGAAWRRQRGIQAHQRHGWWVWLSQLLRTVAITVAIIALLAYLLIWSGWLT